MGRNVMGIVFWIQHRHCNHEDTEAVRSYTGPRKKEEREGGRVRQRT